MLKLRHLEIGDYSSFFQLWKFFLIGAWTFVFIDMFKTLIVLNNIDNFVIFKEFYRQFGQFNNSNVLKFSDSYALKWYTSRRYTSPFEK